MITLIQQFKVKMPIWLRYAKRQLAFMGYVSDLRLQTICRLLTILMMKVIRMVFGCEFLTSTNRHQVNIDISLQLLASLLDLAELKVESFHLLRLVFKQEYLLDDIDIVVLAELGLGIPWPDDIYKMFEPKVEVARQPFLLHLKVCRRHCCQIALGRTYLR